MIQPGLPQRVRPCNGEGKSGASRVVYSRMETGRSCEGTERKEEVLLRSESRSFVLKSTKLKKFTCGLFQNKLISVVIGKGHISDIKSTLEQGADPNFMNDVRFIILIT